MAWVVLNCRCLPTRGTGYHVHCGNCARHGVTQPSPYPPAKLSVFVFEDDFPLNGEHDAGGGIDVLSPNEPGLGGFEITLFDDAGGTGDATGQPTYDMFNMPLSNSLAGTIDPVTGHGCMPDLEAGHVECSQKPGTFAATPDQCSADPSLKGCQKGVVGMIVTCPKYESDGMTLSPMAGQAIVNNLYPGRYGVVATPGADRIARGEEWLQTNTLDGQKAHDSFMRIGEPTYFQEFGPAGYHVTIGFANPTIINERRKNSLALPGRNPCNNEVKGQVTTARMSRTPDERLYGSGSRDSFSFTQCYVSLGDPDGEDFAFVKCDHDGNFDFRQYSRWQLEVHPVRPVERPDRRRHLDSCRDWRPTPPSLTWERLPRTSGRPTSTLVPSSTATETAFRTWVATAIRPSRVWRWSRPTSASATVASRTSTTPT